MCWNSGGSDDAEASVDSVADSPEVAAISSPCPENFVIILGAPGTYDSRDPAHDRGWGHFFVLVQQAFRKNLVSKRPNECVHWFVYGPGYEERWEDDKNSSQRAQIDAANRYPNGYLKRIEEWTTEQGHTFHNMNSVDEFLNGFKTLPPESLSRIWFSGHAAVNLWLHLYHSSGGSAMGREDRWLEVSDLRNAVHGKVKLETGAVSKLYGCNTSEMAEALSSKGLITEGAQNSINFSYIDSDVELYTGEKLSGNHLERIENGNASASKLESPRWTRYGG